MLGNRGSGFDTGCLLTKFLFFVNLVGKNSLIVKKKNSFAKMEAIVYERDKCVGVAAGKEIRI